MGSEETIFIQSFVSFPSTNHKKDKISSIQSRPLALDNVSYALCYVLKLT